MEKTRSNFSVSSKGYCFLCLNKIPCKFISTVISDNYGRVDISSSTVYSLHDISRYLKVDMRKVFIQGGPIPPQLLAKVERSKLQVELCENCGSMAENVSNLCRQLEKLKMEIESGLGSIHEKMLEADETGRTEQFRSNVSSEFGLGMGGGIEIMKALRNETLQKSSRKISRISPRLQIQRLTTEEIQVKTHRIQQKEIETDSEPGFSDSGLDQVGNMEEPDTGNLALEDDSRSDLSLVDDSLPANVNEEGDARLNRATNRHGEVVRRMEVAGTTSTGTLQRKWTINPLTGKYKCQLCTMEYTSQPGLSSHFDTVHRKIRIKCKICEKEFTRGASYKVHHQSAHLGIRFQCRICKKIFTIKTRLMAHQRKDGCAAKVELKLNLNN